MIPEIDPPTARTPLPLGPLCFLIGTTASGKSELAPLLAERAGAEILSMDSMLVYRGMDIGTAKPSAQLRARAPHHLLDLVEPWETFSAQRYIELAHAALLDAHARGKRALFVGGTALYLKLLTHGLFEGPDVDPKLRAELDRRWTSEGAAALHLELSSVDAPSAARIHANDRKRVVRALEVWQQTGRALSDWQREWRSEGDRAPGRKRRVVGLEVPAAELDRRIPLRTRELLDRGWLEEARAIAHAGGFSATARQALGYTDVLAWADGELDRAECERRINLRTRQFARRQRTWFRQFPELRWIAGKTQDLAALADEVLREFEDAW